MENFLLILSAKYLIILLPIISGLYFIYQPPQKKKELIIFSIATITIIGFLALLSGNIYYNPRPFVVEHFIPLIPHASDNGFPSDHILLASAIAVIFSFYNRKLAVLLQLLTILIAYSRVAVGVHHYIDIIGSITISILSAFTAYNIIEYVKHRKSF